MVNSKSLEAIRGIVLACLAALALGLASHTSAHGPEPQEETAAQQNSQGDGQRAEPEASEAGGNRTAVPGAHDAADAGGSILSNLHPASVHFPVALLIMAALVEALNMLLRQPTLRNAVDVMAVIGGVSAVIAAGLGWAHTGLWFGGEATLQWHRLLGTGMAVLGVLLAVLVVRNKGRVVVRLLLATLLLGALVQGYIGGEVAHGPYHLLRS